MAGRKFAIEPEAISLRIGKANVQKIRDFAVKESIRKSAQVTPSDIVKEALEKAFPSLFGNHV